MLTERPFDDAAQMASTLAQEIAACLRDAVSARGAASFVATGGTTPAPLYRALARCKAPWASVTVTLSDERWVAADDPASNEALVRRTLLIGPALASTFIPLKTGASRAHDAVGGVDQALRSAPRPFDVCLLGLGADGHIASLIPGAAGYDDAMVAADHDPLVHAIVAPNAAGSPERLTLTLAALRASRLIVVMFIGAAKLAAYRAARADANETPLRALLAGTTAPVWVCWAPEGPP